MSKRRDIEEHVRTLGEIEGIMGAMRNLALMESHKLSRVLAMQHQVVDEIENAGRDFLSCNPNCAPDFSGHDLYLLIGSERGFCRDFNDRLLSAFDDHLRTAVDRDPVVVVVVTSSQFWPMLAAPSESSTITFCTPDRPCAWSDA